MFDCARWSRQVLIVTSLRPCNSANTLKWVSAPQSTHINSHPWTRHTQTMHTPLRLNQALPQRGSGRGAVGPWQGWALNCAVVDGSGQLGTSTRHSSRVLQGRHGSNQKGKGTCQQPASASVRDSFADTAAAPQAVGAAWPAITASAPDALYCYCAHPAVKESIVTASSPPPPAPAPKKAMCALPHLC